MSDINTDTSVIQHGNQQNPKERITHGLAIIDTNHGQVHAGNAFHYSAEFEGLASGTTFELTLDVPSNAYVHFQSFEGSSSLAYDLEIIEGDTPTTGTEYTPICRHRIKDETSALTLHDTAVSANTLQLVFKHYPGTIQGGSGVLEEGIEWVLAQSTSYTFRIRNEGGQNANGYISLDWYEEGSA